MSDWQWSQPMFNNTWSYIIAMDHSHHFWSHLLASLFQGFSHHSTFSQILVINIITADIEKPISGFEIVCHCYLYQSLHEVIVAKPFRPPALIWHDLLYNQVSNPVACMAAFLIQFSQWSRPCLNLPHRLVLRALFKDATQRFQHQFERTKISNTWGDPLPCVTRLEKRKTVRNRTR
jgi:hypothetical protein